MITKRAPSRCFSQPGVYSGSHRLEVCPAFPRAERAAARAACTRAESFCDCCIHCSPLHVFEGFCGTDTRSTCLCATGQCSGPSSEGTGGVAGGARGAVRSGSRRAYCMCRTMFATIRQTQELFESFHGQELFSGCESSPSPHLAACGGTQSAHCSRLQCDRRKINVPDDVPASFLAAPGSSASRTTLTTTLLHVSAPP